MALSLRSSIPLSRSLSLSLSLATNRPHGYCFIAYSILRRGCVGTSRTQLCIRNALTRPCRHFHPIVCEMLVFLSLFLNEEDEDETVKCARKWRIGSKAKQQRISPLRNTVLCSFCPRLLSSLSLFHPHRVFHPPPPPPFLSSDSSLSLSMVSMAPPSVRPSVRCLSRLKPCTHIALCTSCGVCTGL